MSDNSDNYLSDLYQNLLNYIIEGLAVGIIAYFIFKQKLSGPALLVLVITATATFAVIDFLSPKIGRHVRQGTGFGLGATMTGIRMFNLPGVPVVPGIPII